VILWRLLPWQADAAPDRPGGALWFPRELQGAGRHDNPERYGCLYVSQVPTSAVAEALAPFRGTGALTPAMLVRAGLPLALVELDLDLDPGSGPGPGPGPGPGGLLNLDDPRVLVRTRLRPSEVATNARAVTQAYAARLFDEHPDAIGLRWWSTLEAGLANVTLYDRAASRLTALATDRLTPTHPAVREAAELLGLMAPHPAVQPHRDRP
jgi:RES domain